MPMRRFFASRVGPFHGHPGGRPSRETSQAAQNPPIWARDRCPGLRTRLNHSPLLSLCDSGVERFCASPSGGAPLGASVRRFIFFIGATTTVITAATVVTSASLVTIATATLALAAAALALAAAALALATATL